MQTFWDNVLRLVAVIGLIAVLLLGAWGVIQLAFMLPTFFSGLGGSLSGHSTATAESVVVSVPAAVNPGQPFTVTWRHTGGTGEFAYGVSYACTTGVSLAASVPTGSYQNVPCNTPFNYVNASSSMPLVATLADGTKSAQVALTVAATKLSTNAVTVSSTATTNVSAPASTAAKPSKTATTATKPKTTSTQGGTYYPSGRTVNLSGYPDLAVQILSASSQSGNATVQFAISNVGTNVSPAGWSFNAILPAQGGYTYPVGNQQALYPGDRIVYVLRYSEDNTQGGYGNPCNGWSFPCTPPTPTYGGPGTCNAYGPCNVPGYAPILYGNSATYNTNYNYTSSGSWFFGNTHTITVTVDPYSQVIESTKYNNTASQTYIAY